MRAILLAAILCGTLFVGCMAAPGGEVREAWRAERPPPSQIGEAGSFNFRSDEWYVTGDQRLGPLRPGLRFSPVEDAAWIFFPDARLPGYASGVLGLYTNASIEVTAGQIAGVAASAIHGGACGTCITVEPQPMGFRPGPPTIEAEQRSDVRRAYQQGRFITATLTDVSLDGFTEAVLFQDGQPMDISNETLEDLDATGWIQKDDVVLHPASDQVPLEASTDRFALAGDLEGFVRTSGHGNIPDPAGVFGNVATLHLEGQRIWTDGDIRITQVLRGDAPVFDAGVEFAPAEPILTVEQGRTDWLAINYRETTFGGDAVLEDIQVTGRGASMVTVPTRSEWLVEELWDIVLDTAEDEPWAAPFVAVPIALVTPWAVIAELISCAFGECPQAHPYPVWMPAADVGVFYVKVKADKGPGDHDVLVWMHGQNFDTETFTFTVKVT